MSNHITVEGKIGQDPELRFTTSGMAVAEFSVADTYGKDDKKKTTWHNCTAFGSLAENIVASLKKGNTVIVTGRYEQDEYTKKDGTKGKSIKFIVDACGPSLRWDVWLKDRSADTIKEVFAGAKVGRPMPAVEADEEPF
jgi:single-strand DNA-binding protein